MQNILNSLDFESLFPPFIACLIGACIGFIELTQRYPEPTKFIKSLWPLLYILFNAIVSLIGYAVVYYSDMTAEETAALIPKIKNALLAGFGAQALLRAKILSVTGKSGEDFAIGPEILIQSFLKMIDREIDRSLGSSRLEIVHKLMHNVIFEKAAILLPYEISLAMKRIEPEETEKLLQNISDISETPLTSQEKSYQLGYYLLDLAGEEFLRTIVDKTKQDSPDILQKPVS